MPGRSPPILMACPAMGTRFELVLPGEDPVRLRAAGEAAVEEILHWHRRLSYFDRGSFVSFVNAEAPRRAVECDGEFFDLLRLCGEVWRVSAGAFDPTVAALMRASGFRDLPRDQNSIAGAIGAVGFDKVELDDQRRTVRFTHAGVGLDFGAVGKGWALDRARAALQEAGVECALLHGGTSSVLGMGAPEGETGWSVVVGRRADAPTVHLRDAALGVSAPHGRVVGGASGQHGHVLDPRTGHSAQTVSLAAVIAASAALADAWSTALLVETRRPTGMPSDVTSLLAPSLPDPAGWRLEGPNATTLTFPSDPPTRSHS